MGTVEWLQTAQLILTMVATIGVPVIINNMRGQNAHRETVRVEMHGRLNHLDECVDDLKKRVLGESASRAELARLQAEVVDTLNRMRLAISAETNGLHQRIMRLEDAKMRENDVRQMS